MIHVYHNTHAKKTSGFSLVELSIVLVILGLLVGGVLTGRDLIKAAELRSVSTEYNNWIIAVNLFKEKYMAVPGDMKNATSFWGAADGGDGLGDDCYAIDASTLADPKNTCNGDNNGRVYGGGTGNWANAERFLFWQHLSNAGFIAGSYSGRTGSASNTFLLIADKNVPASKKSGWVYGAAGFATTYTGNANYFDGAYYFNAVDLRSPPNNSSVIASEDLWNIDMKSDDGKPGTGKIRSTKRSGTYSSNCATGDTVDADYDIGNTQGLCFAIFALQ